jgi:hypothetical protein
MSIKPSDSEQEYFARQEAERKRRLAEEVRARLAAEEREKARQLHYMKCPKCGMALEEIEFAGVKVDKCFACEGMWFDKGEVEAIGSKEPGFVGRLLGVFKG